MTNKHKQKRKIRGLNSDLNQNFNIGKMKNMIALEKYYKNLEINKKAVISPVPETEKNTSTDNIAIQNQIKTVSNKTDEYASTDKPVTLERMVSWSNFSELIQFLGAGYAWVFLIVTISSFLSGCSLVSGDLTRSSAASIISESNKFKKPETMGINLGIRIRGITVETEQAEDNDTLEKARTRATEIYAARQVDLAVADHPGLIKPELINGKYLKNNELGFNDNNYRLEQQNYGKYFFDIRLSITVQGENLWKGIDIKYKAALPLAVREIREIIGMVGEDEISGKVDFIFIWKPTLLGKSLNPHTEEFKKLPEELQDRITEKEYKILQIKTAARNYSSNYRGSLRFRKYGNGWRLRELYVGGL
jgi:hypothetical protein